LHGALEGGGRLKMPRIQSSYYAANSGETTNNAILSEQSLDHLPVDCHRSLAILDGYAAAGLEELLAGLQKSAQ
jgi:hypothetical protein